MTMRNIHDTPAPCFGSVLLPGQRRRAFFAFRMRMAVRIVVLCVAVCATACGLADNERDEKNKYEYIVFSDAAFEGYCLGAFDGNRDGRISLYEAERVVRIDCPGLEIRSLYDIRYFKNLQRLDCANNLIADLDVSTLSRLERLDCSRNRLIRLGVRDLRSLTALHCSDNALAALDLGGTASLTLFEGRANAYPLLDVRGCATSLRADVKDNPLLETVYCLVSQSIDSDGHTELVRN